MKLRAFKPIVLLSFCFPVVCGATTLSLHNSTPTEGREVFEELSSSKIFTQAPVDFVSATQMHLLVAGMACEEAGHYIPNDLVELTVNYIASDHRYSTQELERIKKETETVKKDFLSKAFMDMHLIPLSLQDKIQIKRYNKSKIYPVNNILDHLLFGKEKKSILQICRRSLLCSCFCHCCKESPEVSLQEYEAVIEAGWDDTRIVEIKKLIDLHVDQIWEYYDQDMHRTVGFYMDPAYLEKQV